MKITLALACTYFVPPNWVSMREPSRSYWTAALMPSSSTPTMSYIATKWYTASYTTDTYLGINNVPILDINARILFAVWFSIVTFNLKQYLFILILYCRPCGGRSYFLSFVRGHGFLQEIMAFYSLLSKVAICYISYKYTRKTFS